MYKMLRVFCATAWELEGERRAFNDALGEFNETEAMKHGLLYVPVSLTNIRDKRPWQYDIEENIGACRAYILALADGSWGPPERNFERDLALAAQQSANPDFSMRDVTLLYREPSSPPKFLPAGVTISPFSGTKDFVRQFRALMSTWLATDLAMVESPAPAGVSPAL
jgi:hypothetical protein